MNPSRSTSQSQRACRGVLSASADNHQPLLVEMQKVALLTAHQQQMRLHHKGDSGTGEQSLELWTPQDAFFKKPLLHRPGGITDLPNRKKDTQKPRQNGEAEKYTPQKRTRYEKRLNEREITNFSIKISKQHLQRCSLTWGKELMISVRVSTKRQKNLKKSQSELKNIITEVKNRRNE